MSYLYRRCVAYRQLIMMHYCHIMMTRHLEALATPPRQLSMCLHLIEHHQHLLPDLTILIRQDPQFAPIKTSYNKMLLLG